MADSSSKIITVIIIIIMSLVWPKFMLAADVLQIHLAYRRLVQASSSVLWHVNFVKLKCLVS